MARKSRRRQTEEPVTLPEWSMNPETKRGILVVALLAVAIFAGLSFFDLAGPLGRGIDKLFTSLLGWDRLLLVPLCLFLAVKSIFPDRFRLGIGGGVGLVLLVFCLNAFIELLTQSADPSRVPWVQGGGLVGLFLVMPLVTVMGSIAAGVVIVALFLMSVLLTFNLSLRTALGLGAPWRMVMNMFGRVPEGPKIHGLENGESTEDGDEPDEQDEEEDDTPAPAFETRTVEVSVGRAEQEAPAEPLRRVPRPRISIPLDLLNTRATKPQAGDIERTSERIRSTLEQFGIPVEMGDISIGPTVTQYTLKPSEGIKLTRITSLSNDLALALAAHPIRIEAPIPGKSLVGIEVPNQSIAIVPLRDVLESREFRERKSQLAIALGKDVSGKSWTASVDKMPHMLVAGATGSGKSVCLNTLIVSLLYENGPDDLRFIMVDPKRVELTVYNGIPHLVTPVITDVPKTVNALKWAIGEMERRFDLLAKAGKRDIASYNAASPEKLPYLVIIIDELADLMVAAAAEVEGLIVRLAQMARAVGIHLVLATQRPSVDVITGLIKANITTRIAFSVASLIDSRTILDSPGAEKLLGRGDMLFINAELSTPKRLQGTFVSDEEIKRVTEFIEDRYGRADYVEGVTEKPTGPGSTTIFGDSDSDPLFEEARRTVVMAGKASASLLQRRLKVGYARAARLLDLLEEAGMIGPGDGAKPREILVRDPEIAEMHNIDQGEDVTDSEADDGSDAEGGEDEPDDEEDAKPSPAF